MGGSDRNRDRDRLTEKTQSEKQTDRQTDRQMLHYKLSAVLLQTLTHVSLGLTKHWPCL